MKLIVTMHVHQHCPQLCLFKKIIKLCLLVFFCAEKRKEKYGGFQQTFVKDSMLQLYFLTNEYLLCAEMYTQHGIRFNLDIKLLKKKKKSLKSCYETMS